MHKGDDMNSTRQFAFSGVAWWNVVFGIWLAISPFVLGFSNPALRWNNLATGIAVAVLAFVSRSDPVKGLMLLLGAWLFASSFVLGFSRATVLWNNLIMALLVIVGSLWSAALETVQTRER